MKANYFKMKCFRMFECILGVSKNFNLMRAIYLSWILSIMRLYVDDIIAKS